MRTAFRHLLQIMQTSYCHILRRLARVQLSGHRAQHMH
jgi:hypothetical protein